MLALAASTKQATALASFFGSGTLTHPFTGSRSHAASHTVYIDLQLACLLSWKGEVLKDEKGVTTTRNNHTRHLREVGDSETPDVGPRNLCK